MRTQAQRDASRKNGARSRGPKTAEGKKRSALNAVAHGIYALTSVLPCEDPAEFGRLLEDLRGHFDPSDHVELHYLRDLADARWRLERVIGW